MNNIQDTNSNKDHFTFNLFDTGVILAILTAFGYAIAYSYQKGFWLYFGITQEFLTQISIVNVMISISVIGTSFVLVIIHYFNFRSSLTITNNVFRQMLIKVSLPTFFFAFGIIILMPINILPIKPIYFIFAIIFLLVAPFILPLITLNHIKGYKNKLNAYLEKKELEGVNLKNIVFLYKNSPTAKYVYLIVIFLTGIFISLLLGYKTAAQKENYLMVNLNKFDYLVLDSDGEKLIIAPVNLERKEIELEFQLIEKSAEVDNPIIFKKVKIIDGIKVNKVREFK